MLKYFYTLRVLIILLAIITHTYLLMTFKCSLIASFMGPTWGPSEADMTQVGPMLAPWNLLSALLSCTCSATEPFKKLTPGINIFSCDQAAIWLVQSVRLSVRPSVRPSVCLSVCHTFFTMFPSSYHHEIFRSYYHGQKWCPCKRSRSEVKGQGHRGQHPT